MIASANKGQFTYPEVEMYKTEELVSQVGVRIDPRTRVERLQEQATHIQLKLGRAEKLKESGRGPSPSKLANLKFQLGRIMGKLSAVPTTPEVYV